MVRTNMNPPSRFIKEIPVDLLEGMEPVKGKSRMASRASGSTLQSQKQPFTSRRPSLRPTIKATGGEGEGWKVGDKAQHGKWGTGTVVSVKGEGEGTELDIAFPSPDWYKTFISEVRSD